MNKLNQKGFGAVELVLIIVVIIALGLIGYVILHKQTAKKATPTTSTAVSPQSSTTTINGQTFIVIKDWGIRIPLDDTLKGVTVSTPQKSSYSDADTYVNILVPQLDSSYTCTVGPDGVKGTIGTISQTTKAKRDGPYEPLVTKKIGQNTYGFEALQSGCFSDTKLFDQISKDFQTQFAKAEASN